MSLKRIFIIDQDGIRNPCVDIPCYEFPTVIKAIERTIKNHRVVEIPLYDTTASYIWEKPVVRCYVLNNQYADEHLIHLCRIAERTPEDHVYAASTCEGLVSLHKTIEGAHAAQRALADAGEIGTYLSLEKIED